MNCFQLEKECVLEHLLASLLLGINARRAVPQFKAFLKYSQGHGQSGMIPGLGFLNIPGKKGWKMGLE